jgi:hypothetical protein
LTLISNFAKLDVLEHGLHRNMRAVFFFLSHNDRQFIASSELAVMVKPKVVRRLLSKSSRISLAANITCQFSRRVSKNKNLAGEAQGLHAGFFDTAVTVSWIKYSKPIPTCQGFRLGDIIASSELAVDALCKNFTASSELAVRSLQNELAEPNGKRKKARRQQGKSLQAL